MPKQLRVLIIEDSEDDALLLLRELQRGGYKPEFERVERPEDMKEALEKKEWDIIISDYVLPGFSGLAALTILKECSLDLPFIIVSGNIGEDIAVGAMKAGAHDYIIKGSLKRLVPAIERELRDAEVRRGHKEADNRIDSTNALLKLFSRSLSRKEYLDSVVELLLKWCDCRCAGIRILDERGNIPYEANTGFSREFLESENMLSVRKDQCACVRVIIEKPDPVDARFMTEGGSFFSCDIRKYVGEFTEQEKTCLRGVCVKSGFSSVAIIPIRYSGKVIGAVHLSDEREGKVPLKSVEFIESIAPLIGEALYKFAIEENLEKKNKELRSLSAHLQNALEKERANVAREIHDELGQVLTALKLDLSWLSDKYRDHKILSKKTSSMIEIVNATIKTVKKICSQLRPGVLDDLGLTAAIEWQAGEFQKRSGIACDVSFIPEDIVLDKDRSTALFRVFQETLTNIIRHSEATKVRAFFRKRNGEIFARIEDNGKGISTKQISSPRSFGLIGIRERVLSFGGRIEIKGIRNKGTAISIRIPLEKEKV